ncbi:MAG: hypothetical protein NE334_04340 [Lentisphaeraceae bacterium]|nr:hypothetical protein [Lentisphaeraceae bacterium]
MTVTYKRRGTLWEQRFKCTKLVGSEALVSCLQYVELNPVRAEIVEDPKDYRFSTYSIWHQRGTHPFQKSFKKHMLPALSIYLDSRSLKGLQEYFRSRFASMLSLECEDPANILLTRSRYWIDSVVLGSQIALRDHSIDIWGKQRGKKKRFTKFCEAAEEPLFGLRRLS